ncbi:MAG TPA: TerD family protein [Cytophagaceae bacterium]|jgi:tellurium resistance protein TerD|nr:TerD family protein [Cytophagaceae bacterium]
MSINLKKGSSFNLTKDEPTLKKVMVGLGWDMSTHSIDLDASAFMLNTSLKLPSDNYFIFYNNLKSPDSSVQHTGDNRTGEGSGDDEMILINLDSIDSKISEIIFIVTMHESKARGHHFGLLQNAYIRLYDVDSKREVLRYTLDSERGKNSDMEFGKLQKINNEWKFTALGNGGEKGLQGYVDIYA